MSMTGDSPAMRPLSIGEIFDRAVTLYVRHFVLFTLIMLVVTVPITVASDYATLGNPAYRQILQQATHPPRTPTPPLATLGPLLQLESSLGLVVLLAVFIGPYASIATVIAIATIYRGAQPSWSTSYRSALRRWPSVLGATLMELLIFFAIALGGGLVFGIMAAIGALALRGSPAGIVIFIIFIVAAAIAWMLAFVLCGIAMGFAFNAIAIENADTFDALGSGFSRIFNRRELGRALLVVLAMAAIYIGIYIVSALVGALTGGLTHSFTLGAVVEAPISLISSAFIAILFAVYYFDVRVRREGLDLQSAFDRLEPQATA